jgi:hypothetical protein
LLPCGCTGRVGDLAPFHVEAFEELFDLLFLMELDTFGRVFDLYTDENVNARKSFDFETVAQTLFDL